ncbi:hypothetical protein QYF61_016443 [Mycteria americana]|uniref:Uncharacterized protein n=1 Tax=Mycteria americana TaxID=33587 RepID=A0AAN7RRJ8_MYCAM|nr:hypothetical protein QYF61_016443 [Mycteria americana]
MQRKTFALEKPSSYQFPRCIIELLVPHAVDERIHCWRNHGVQTSHHQIQGWGGDGQGPQVGNHAGTDKQGDHSQGIGHGFGDSGGDGAQVKNREVEEEEVHGAVEAVVAGYGSDDETVAQEGSQVDAQEEPEVQELQLRCVRKGQEEELGHLPSALCLQPSLVLAMCVMKSRASALPGLLSTGICPRALACLRFYVGLSDNTKML